MACDSTGINERRVNQFNKIKLLDQIATQIGLFGVNQGNETLMDYVDLNCGAIPEGEFETVIDLSAPHQFLQMYMQIAEKRFAFTCTELLKMNPGYMVALKDFLRRTGCELNSEKVETALQAFEKMDFYVLDGMPCDETKTIVEKSDEKITWKISMDTHKDAWLKAGGNPDVYYELMQDFVNGILATSGMNCSINREGGCIQK